ncbi:sulfur carrier protein ThiS [Hansschlegelia zhihuaiae]|uniref:Sulfur carrier protein ThiS n=1 Tax=Hansschlegelia zhihuaiae TaxID=405005 RepID=A0A4Q0M3Q1_9HYPH|nr:sulfur carrier protein ThiS [Hansschlegelia zhihuaiae]RXF67423.1 sulfur carrier protein ThiS [Hansschlegelia zhihuaiae]
MRLIVNGASLDVQAETLSGALAALDYGDAIVATAVNGAFVPASARRDRRLEDGDRIEIVAPRQGG